MEPADSSRMNAPTVFQGFWHGPPLGPVRAACLDSFVRCGHAFELYVYDEIEVPRGVVLRDAVEIIPRSAIFYYENVHTGKKDLGPFSDLFRYKLLFDRGGWWSDVDTVCLSAQIPKVGRAWAGEYPEVHAEAIGTSQLALPCGDPLAKLLYERCLELSKKNLHVRESLGPLLLSATIGELRLPRDVFGDPDKFYPMRWIEMFKLWLPEYADDLADRAARALFMPIYQSVLQSAGLAWGPLPPRGSFLARVCDEAGIDGSDRYDALDIVEATRRFFKGHGEWAVAELCAVGGEADLRFLDLGL